MGKAHGSTSTQNTGRLPHLSRQHPRRATHTTEHIERATGEPGAVKAASPVRRGADGKVPMQLEKNNDGQLAGGLPYLKGIRMRVRARKSQRTVLHSWSFFQLQAFIAYKARQVGIPVVLVNPRNTSRTCPACGHIAKANRATQAAFTCVRCGCAGHADTIAAGNIRVLGRAAVMQPHISESAGCSSQRQVAGL
jgi:transposase